MAPLGRAGRRRRQARTLQSDLPFVRLDFESREGGVLAAEKERSGTGCSDIRHSFFVPKVVTRFCVVFVSPYTENNFHFFCPVLESRKPRATNEPPIWRSQPHSRAT